MEQKKKIIFLEAVQDYGGARISTVELAERLSARHDVTIVDFYGSCKPFLDAVENRNLDIKIIEKRDTPYIINTSSSAFVKAANIMRFVPHFLKVRKKLHETIRKLNPDYIILNNSKVLSALAGYKDKKIKTVFFARGWFIPQQISTIDRIFYKRYVDRYACVSVATKQALFAGGLTTLDNLFVVHNAIAEEKLSKDIAPVAKGENTKVILHAGGFLKDKGQLVSLEMAEILKSRNIDFKLILAGLVYSGSESEKFYDTVIGIIKEKGLEDVIEIVKNNPNIINYFNACDILIHPSETEGLPRVIMEAMILKKPVVANAVGGVTDYILNGYTGFLPNHNSAKGYADAVELLIKNKDTYDSIAENSYELVRDCFSEKNQLDSLFRMFNN